MSIRRSSKKRGGTLSVAVIVVAFLIVMVFQIVQLKNKETAYAQQTAELNKQLKEETERTDDINALADYMKGGRRMINKIFRDYMEDEYNKEKNYEKIIFKEKEN